MYTFICGRRLAKVRGLALALVAISMLAGSLAAADVAIEVPLVPSAPPIPVGVDVAASKSAPPARFRVLKIDGTPLANGEVRVGWSTAANSTTWTEMTTDAEGTLRLSDPPLQGTRIGVTARGQGYGQSEPVQVPTAPDAPPVDIKLKQGARLSGLVVNQATGNPVKGAWVHCWCQNMQPSGSEASQGDGKWERTDLPPGTCQISVSADKYVPTQMDVDLAEGQDMADIRLELVPLAKVAVTVLAEDGQTPIPGAEVRWQGDSLRTDAQGRVAVFVPPDEEQALTVITENYAAHSEPLSAAGAKPPAERRIVLRDRGGTVSGLVTDRETGKPVAGVQVFVLPYGEESEAASWIADGSILRMGTDSLQGWGIVASRSSTTGPDGRYAIAQIVARKSIVVGFVEHGLNVYSEPFDVVSGQPAAVDLIATRRPLGYITGRLLLSDGKPLAEAEIAMCQRHDAGQDGQNWQSTGLTTDHEGRYYLKIQQAGTTRFVVMVQGYAMIEQVVQVPEVNVSAEVDLHLKAEKADASISGRVFLSDGTTPASGVQVVAFVEDRPWPEGGSSFYAEGRQTVFIENRQNRHMLTATDGTFRIEGLRPGRYGVYASPSRELFFWNQPARPDLAGYLPGLSDQVTVAESGRAEGLRVVLAQGGMVKGQVLDAATGTPLAEAEVQLSWSYSTGLFSKGANQPPPNFWAMETTSDAEGKFSLAGVPPGQYHLAVRAEGYKPLQLSGWRSLKVRPGATLDRTLKLTAE